MESIKPLTFKIKGHQLIHDINNAARPATQPELAMWDRLQEMEKLITQPLSLKDSPVAE